VFDSHAIYALLMSGVFLLIAAFSVMFVQDKVDNQHISQKAK
jgi:inner membrane protein involved in colicin E2 resistance